MEGGDLMIFHLRVFGVRLETIILQFVLDEINEGAAMIECLVVLFHAIGHTQGDDQRAVFFFMRNDAHFIAFQRDLDASHVNSG
jgi:hypothetical protein